MFQSLQYPLTRMMLESYFVFTDFTLDQVE